VLAVLRHSLTEEEIGEVLLHTAVPAGVPAANRAYAIAQHALENQPRPRGLAGFRYLGLRYIGYWRGLFWTVIQRSSVNSSRAASPPNRPQPLSLTPPNGIWGSSWTVVSLM
jgi:hypothetical protein